MPLLNNNPAHAGTCRLAISGYVKEDWYFCWSPSNPTFGAEGPWQEWVSLAEEILKENEKFKQETDEQAAIDQKERSYAITS